MQDLCQQRQGQIKMNKDSKGKSKRKENIGRILRTASRPGEVSERTNAKIDRWLLDNENDPELRDAEGEIFDSEVFVQRKPSRDALESLAEAKRRVGLEDSAPKIPLYRRTYFRVASAAAVVLIAVGAGFLFNTMQRGGDPVQPVQVVENTQSVQIPEVTIEAIGGINKDTHLADNTRVWVNENSKVTYPEEFGDERHVKLTGHARFEVAHNEAKPFFVHTERLHVRVLGTDFHVKEHGDTHTEVVLYRGSVEVVANDKAERLTPGEILTYDHSTGAMTIEKIETDTIDEWRTNKILALHKTVPELLRMIDNCYDIRIAFDAAEFDGEQYVFSFDKSDPIDTVMEMVSVIVGGIDYELSSDSTTINIKPIN